MRGLVIGDDDRVAAWAFATYNRVPSAIDAAVGVADSGGTLVGAILFQGFNGNDVQISYYGERTLTVGIARSIARIAVGFDVARATVVTDKNRRKYIRTLRRVGFETECVMRRYYGRTDGSRHAAMRLVMYRERIDQIAGVFKNNRVRSQSDALGTPARI